MSYRLSAFLWLCFALSQVFLLTHVNQLLTVGQEARGALVDQAQTEAVLETETSRTLGVKHPSTGCHLSQKTYIGFVRTPKTGSTSLQKALHDAFEHVHRLPRFFPLNEDGAPKSTIRTDPPANFHTDSCYFSFSKAYNQTEGLLKPHHSEGACAHNSYSVIKEHFDKRRPFLLNGNELGVDKANRVSRLQVFTMIREPFEHLSSNFFYSHAIYPAWKNGHTKLQNECVEKGDFECWLNLLHKEGATKPSTHQFGMLAANNDLQEGIKLLTRSSSEVSRQGTVAMPEVLVLLNECFDTSIRLLVDLVPHVFHGDADSDGDDGGDIDGCSRETHRDPEVTKRLEDYLAKNYKIRPTGAKKKVKSGNETHWMELREKAKDWFPDSFAFYKAAAAQFRELLLDSTVERKYVDECLSKLDPIIGEM